MKAILQLLSLSTSLTTSLPAIGSPLQSSVVLKPITIARSLFRGLKFTVSSVDFFTTVEHDANVTLRDGATEQVQFFTDRPIKFNEDGSVVKFLSGGLEAQPAELTMGRISVHNAKVLPTGIAPPDELKEHGQENSATSIQINDVYRNLDRFLDEIERTCNESDAKKICIFIPGFCMSFDQSIASAGALQKYSKIPVVLYSWPSQDSPFVWSYFADASCNEKSMSQNGSKIIDAIANRIGAEKVVLVGFSQGAKLAVQYAVERQSSAAGADPFYAQIFSRADQPQGDFQTNLPVILNNAKSTALFVSRNDHLLLVSGHLLHRRLFAANKRIGSVSYDKFVVPAEFEQALHLIDDSASNNKITNHTFNARGIANWLNSLNVLMLEEMTSNN